MHLPWRGLNLSCSFIWPISLHVWYFKYPCRFRFAVFGRISFTRHPILFAASSWNTDVALAIGLLTNNLGSILFHISNGSRYFPCLSKGHYWKWVFSDCCVFAYSHQGEISALTSPSIFKNIFRDFVTVLANIIFDWYKKTSIRAQVKSQKFERPLTEDGILFTSSG